MRILVTGSRSIMGLQAQNYTKNALEMLLATHKEPIVASPPHTLIVGEARGIDSIAFCLAGQWGWFTEVYYADWQHYSKAAGPIRNQEMLTKGKPDIALAVWDGHSPGTLDMICRCAAAGLPITIHIYRG